MKDEVYVNVRGRGEYTFVTVCDADLLGKTLREGRIVIHVREEFYGGHLISVEDAMKIVRRYDHANLIGEKAVGKAVEEGLVHREAVLTVAGVPHALIMRSRF